MKEELNLPAKLVRIKDAAKYLAVSEKTLWNLENEGKIPAVRFGRTIRYAVEDLDAFIQKHRAGSSPEEMLPETPYGTPSICRSYPDYCINCYYWFEKAGQGSTDKIGYCKRFPPQFVAFTENKPQIWNFYTGHNNWCGEFKPM